MQRFKGFFGSESLEAVPQAPNYQIAARFRKMIAALGGPAREFTLEHRIFNISAFFITTFAFIGGIANLLIGLNGPVVWLSFLGGRFRTLFSMLRATGGGFTWG